MQFTGLLVLVADTKSNTTAVTPIPQSSFRLVFERACDATNRHLYLENEHTFKTIVAQVRWHAPGGKDLTEEFLPAPRGYKEVGCAATAEVVQAKFVDF